MCDLNIAWFCSINFFIALNILLQGKYYKLIFSVILFYKTKFYKQKKLRTYHTWMKPATAILLKLAILERTNIKIYNESAKK